MYENEIWACRRKIKQLDSEIEDLNGEIKQLIGCGEQMSEKVKEASSFKDNLLEKVHRIGKIDSGLAIQRRIIEEMSKVVSGQGFEAFKGSISSGVSDTDTEIEERKAKIGELQREIDKQESLVYQYKSMAREAEEAETNG